MRGASKFHPEWGYLAPAPGFVRMARVALVATTIGATVGAIVVFSLRARPTTESSVSARTLIRPAETASETPAPIGAHERPTLSQPQFPLPQLDTKQTADGTINRSSVSATTKAPEWVAVSTSTIPPSADTLDAPPVAVIGLSARDPRPPIMKTTKKLNVSWRNASHGEPLRRLARGQDLKRTFDGYRETRAQVGDRNVESQSGWFDWDSRQGAAPPQGSPGGFLLGLRRIVRQVFGQSSL
jgi:hypothetical protein